MCDRPSNSLQAPQAMAPAKPEDPSHAVQDALERTAMELAEVAGRTIPNEKDWETAYHF